MNQPTSEIYGVWLDNEFPYKLYGAQQDNSTIIITSQANPYNIRDFRSGPGCETGPIMPHPRDPMIVYGSCKGQYGWMNLETGQQKSYWIGAQSLYGNPARDLILRFQRVSPMATSVHDPDILYYGSQHLHRTRDKGVTWERISPDLTATPEGTQGVSGEPITRDVTGEEFYSTLYAITESPHEPGVIWTGANDGPFHITRDNGKTWANITPKDLPPGGRVQFIEASPHRRGSAYFATFRYLLGDYQPYIYQTDDYGRTWKRLTDGKNGIPADWPTRVVREDPDREGLLYAGTEFGMFISFDNGSHWQPFQSNLPNVPVTDIKVHRKDLVVSTQGRAFWIMDNISVLHQLRPQVTMSQVFLFKPRDGHRTRVSPNLLGPMIEYLLPNQPAGAVTIEILDGGGNLVNTFSSDAPPQADRGRGGRRARGAPPARVTKKAGLNRFVWNVRHQSGLTALPGKYQARLKVGTTTKTEPFNLLVDPRIKAEGITAADLRGQFEHNERMQELVASVNRTVERVREAQANLRDATGAAAEMEKRVDAIAAKLITPPIRYSKPGLQAHITYLARMTSGVDQKVGRDALERYEVLKKELEAVRAELDEVGVRP